MGLRRISFIFLMLAAVAAAVLSLKNHSVTLPTRPLATQPATTTATLPATTTVSAPAIPTDYMSLVRSINPDFPATQPFTLPVELRESARLIFSDPIYLDPAGELWITRHDAPPTNEMLKKADDDQTHLTRENVVFVHRASDDAGQWHPQIVVREPSGHFTLISSTQNLDLGHAHEYDWDRAFDWNTDAEQTFVVPTKGGVSIFRPRSLPIELHYEFSPAVTGPTQILLDIRGLLAWVPSENGQTGSRGAVRFVDDKWAPLGPEQGWPEKLVHLVPLLDGSVLQLVPQAAPQDDQITVAMSQLDAASVDRAQIDPLIAQLSDPDPKIRSTAYNELTRYGSALWPILEKVNDDQLPQGQILIAQLLSTKHSPTLGTMTLLPGKAHMIARFKDGGAMLLADAGISMPPSDPANPPVITSPAYISFRPSHAVEQASAFLTKDLPADARIDSVPDEWVVTDGANGPRRLLGNHLEPILHKDERAFSNFIGVDRRGRWLFRKPNAATPTPTPTLVLDPTLPNPTPRLAAWIEPAQGDQVGWDAAGWPVFIKGKNAWSLHEADWIPLKESDPYKTELPATAATTTTSDSPIFTASDGTEYFDGQTTLRCVYNDGSSFTWPLPPAAVGNGDAHLVIAGDNRFFLFNQPGRLVRLQRTPGGAERFKVEATFTASIPNTDHYNRIWVDPAGRIDLAYDNSHLTILFPDGRIPPSIAEKMPAEQLKDEGE